jgi:hypothetical protein
MNDMMKMRVSKDRFLTPDMVSNVRSLCLNTAVTTSVLTDALDFPASGFALDLGKPHAPPKNLAG